MPSTFHRRLLLACIGLSLVACVTVGQQRPDGRRRGETSGGLAGFGSGGPLDLLQRPDVQAELELLDEQVKEMQGRVETFNERRRELVRSFADQFRERDAASEADREALRDQVQEAFRSLHKETEASLSFLLPHQRQRLSQLELQFRLRSFGGLGALGTREIGEQLSVTEEQRELLRDKAAELGQEFSRKIAALRREMQEKLLAELTPDQRAKFQELLGDPFEFQDRLPSVPSGGRPPGESGN